MYNQTTEQLRDDFAKQAMLGLMGSAWNVSSFNEIAIRAYELADKMLAARDSVPPTKHLPYEYKAIQFWADRLCRPVGYSAQQQREAADERAPIDAIYKRGDVWVTLRDVTGEEILNDARKQGLIA